MRSEEEFNSNAVEIAERDRMVNECRNRVIAIQGARLSAAGGRGTFRDR